MARAHNAAWKRARKHFGIEGDPNMVLHHKDEKLRKSDIKRYLEWRPEDLVVMSHGEHTKFHHEGKTVSEETRRKISENHVGFLGYHHKEETKSLLSRKSKGIPKSEAARANIRKNHARLRGSDNPTSRRILCIETGEEFFGSGEAQRITGINGGSIWKCCNGAQQTAGGFHWRYSND